MNIVGNQLGFVVEFSEFIIKSFIKGPLGSFVFKFDHDIKDWNKAFIELHTSSAVAQNAFGDIEIV